MAYIKRTGENAFRVRVVLGYDADGKRINKNFTYYPKARKETAQLKEVQNYAAELERKIKNGEYYSGEDMTLNEFFNTWVNDYAPSYISVSKLEQYSQIMRKRFLPKLGYMQINKISPLHLQNIAVSLEKSGLKPATIKTYFTAASSLFNKAYSLGIIRENPCSRIQLPKIESNREEIGIFTEEETEAFLKALDSDFIINHREHVRTLKSSGEAYSVPSYNQTINISTMWKALFYLTVFSQARREEIISLTWEDISYKDCSISITKATASTKEGQIIKETKTKSGNRKIIVPHDVMLRLKEWEEEQKELYYTLGNLWEGKDPEHFRENFIFTQWNGKQLHLSSPTHKIKEVIRLYNSTVIDGHKLPEITFHGLRHSGASLLIAHGMDVATVSARLGHSKTSVTLDRYTHALKGMDRKASDLLENIFFKQDSAEEIAEA